MDEEKSKNVGLWNANSGENPMPRKSEFLRSMRVS